MSYIERTHDKEIYLKEDRYDNPKEIFKMIFERVKVSGGIRPGDTVCDFGCAAGEFLYYLQRQVPTAHYIGYDVVPELLDKARQRVPGPSFRQGSVLDRDLLPEASIDVASMIGVHEIFDEFEPSLSNLLYWTRPGGRVYIFGGFNPYPIDVWVKYRLVDDPNPNHREPGWNEFSKASFSRYLDKYLGPARHTFVPFQLPFELAPHPDDPVRTWTIHGKDSQRMITNGLGLLINLELLEIWR